MTVLEIVLAVLIPAASALIIFIGICVRKTFMNFLKRVETAIEDIELMKDRGNSRKQENMLLFEGILVILDTLSGKEINGNVTKLREKYERHLRNEAIH